MDAIAFVLGLDVKKLRGEALRDLINDEESKRKDEVECYVRMVFVTSDGDEHIFQRSISLKKNKKDPSGPRVWADTLTHNSKVHNKSEYEDALKKIGIITRIPNCLVFQVRPKHHTLHSHS
jgi:chromosome segregation ATPase